MPTATMWGMRNKLDPPLGQQLWTCCVLHPGCPMMAKKNYKRISLSGFWTQQFPYPLPGRDAQGRGQEFRVLLSVACAFLN